MTQRPNTYYVYESKNETTSNDADSLTGEQNKIILTTFLPENNKKTPENKTKNTNYLPTGEQQNLKTQLDG